MRKMVNQLLVRSSRGVRRLISDIWSVVIFSSKGEGDTVQDLALACLSSDTAVSKD
jgi:hypothetical protein